jgi:molybdopterin converting factor small subunit
MMSVRVKLPPILQELSCGVETCEVTGHTVGECLESLEAQFSGIKDYLFDRQGRLLRIFGIYLNSDGLYPLELDTPVQDKDEIIILNFIIGG